MIELLVTLVVLLIVVSSATPIFSNLIAQNRITASVNNLLSTLAIARSLAVTGRGSVVVCSNNGGACGSSSEWGGGALVFIDRDASKAINGTETVAVIQEGMPRLTVSANVAAVVFAADGSATTDDKGVTTAQWLLCDPSGRVEPRIITVREIGHPAVRKVDDCSL